MLMKMVLMKMVMVELMVGSFGRSGAFRIAIIVNRG